MARADGGIYGFVSPLSRCCQGIFFGPSGKAFAPVGEHFPIARGGSAGRQQQGRKTTTTEVMKERRFRVVTVVTTAHGVPTCVLLDTSFVVRVYVVIKGITRCFFLFLAECRAFSDPAFVARNS